MTVVLDSRSLPKPDRASAWRAGLEGLLATPSNVTVSDDASGVLEAWASGTTALYRLEQDGWETTIGPRFSAMRSLAGRASFSVVRSGAVRTSSRGYRVTAPRELRLMDLSSSWLVAFSKNVYASVLEVDCDELGLGVTDIRAAVPRVGRSPLMALFQTTMVELTEVAGSLAPNTASHAVAGLVPLARAVVLSVSEDDRHRREAADATLVPRIIRYVDLHLNDPALNPEQVAEAHNISLRYLYQVFSPRGKAPAEWIMQRRLEAARDDLTSDHGTVADVAYRWGFRDQSHFARRFRSAFGVSPSEWRRR